MKRTIADIDVFPIGLGCMNLSHGYGEPVAFRDAEALLLGALDRGVTLFDTAALYGYGTNETLVGKVLGPHRREFMLASKCGIFQEDGKRKIDGRPETLRRTCDDSLKRLRTEVIDLYYLHRWDKSVPIEDSVGAMSDMVRAGKVRHIGLSEVSAQTLRKAHAVHPIAAVQSEYSLWSRNVEIAVHQACREIGAALVAFSPLGRAFLAGGTDNTGAFAQTDIRRRMPRFQGDAYAHNLTLLDAFRQLATRVGHTPAQLALAWVLRQGDDVIPIPGTTQLDHLSEDLGALDVELDAATCAEMASLFAPGQVMGGRYGATSQQEIDTEEFAAA